MSEEIIGIIGGTGLYEIEGFKDLEEIEVETPFGRPSDKFIRGQLGGKTCVFLARHGRGHRILPHELNFRANIYGMKKLGVDMILSVSAVGSMQEDIHPGDLVFVDQFFDRTRMRVSTFFGGGIAGHIPFADPICLDLSGVLYQRAKKLDLPCHRGGTYLCMEGPQFSTQAESLVYRKWEVSVIGMTNLQEAKLAREAEMCYATIALVTDYDCWHVSQESVSVEGVMKVLKDNVAKAKTLIKEVLPEISPAQRECGCSQALKNAIVTPEHLMPEDRKKDLELIIGKYLSEKE